MRDRADVGVGRCRRIGAGALEQNELRTASLAGSAHRVVELAEASHTSGDDQRLTSGSSFLDQR